MLGSLHPTSSRILPHQTLATSSLLCGALEPHDAHPNGVNLNDANLKDVNHEVLRDASLGEHYVLLHERVRDSNLRYVHLDALHYANRDHLHDEQEDVARDYC
jgi:hypothetical protein